MEKVTITVEASGKPRNPFHKSLAMLGRRVVKSKKGRGSYSRKSKNND